MREEWRVHTQEYTCRVLGSLRQRRRLDRCKVIGWLGYVSAIVYGLILVCLVRDLI